LTPANAPGDLSLELRIILTILLGRIHIGGRFVVGIGEHGDANCTHTQQSGANKSQTKWMYTNFAKFLVVVVDVDVAFPGSQGAALMASK